MAKKKKRKPSAYNRHIGREMKKGATMAEAAASWSKKPSKKKTSKRKPKTTSRRITRRRKPQPKGLIPAVRNVRSKVRNKVQSRVGVKGPIWKVWLLDKINERIGA